MSGAASLPIMRHQGRVSRAGGIPHTARTTGEVGASGPAPHLAPLCDRSCLSRASSDGSDRAPGISREALDLDRLRLALTAAERLSGVFLERVPDLASDRPIG